MSDNQLTVDLNLHLNNLRSVTNFFHMTEIHVNISSSLNRMKKKKEKKKEALSVRYMSGVKRTEDT